MPRGDSLEKVKLSGGRFARIAHLSVTNAIVWSVLKPQEATEALETSRGCILLPGAPSIQGSRVDETVLIVDRGQLSVPDRQRLLRRASRIKKRSK